MSIKVLSRMWDQGSESAKRDAFTMARIVCSRSYGTSKMAKDVKAYLEKGYELGSHDMNSSKGDNIQWKKTDGTYFHGTLFVHHLIKEVKLLAKNIYHVDLAMCLSREQKDFDKLKQEKSVDEILDLIWRPHPQDYDVKGETHSTHYQVTYDCMRSGLLPLIAVSRQIAVTGTVKGNYMVPRLERFFTVDDVQR